MYLMFKYKNMNPSTYYNLPHGEKKLMGYFLSRELKERHEELKAMYGGG